MTSPVIWTIFALIIAITLSFWLYKGTKFDKPITRHILIALRSFSIFMVLLFLINPEINNEVVRYEKPKLAVLVDHSKSIRDSVEVMQLSDRWHQDLTLNSKFDVSWYAFGEELLFDDQNFFDQTETDIGGALAQIQSIRMEAPGPVVLISDGQQTYGRAYEYSQLPSEIPVYPILIGDTLTPLDLVIEKVYTNHYSRVGQKFPVELLLGYSGGNKAIQTELKISLAKEIVWRKTITFSPDQSAQLLQIELPAKAPGQLIYQVDLGVMTGEQNLTNNQAFFGIEILEQLENIVIVSSGKHPDLGALKRALVSNEQVQVTIVSPEEAMTHQATADLLVLYQPNRRFAPLLDIILDQKRNMWLISGPETDWSFLNQKQSIFSKETIGVTDEIAPEAIEEFDLFTSQWTRWADLPPLRTDIGAIAVSGPHQDLLKASIQGNILDQPIMSFYEDTERRWVLLDGVGFWTWRLEAHRLEGSYESIDAFIGSTAKYLSVDRANERLIVDHQPIYQRAIGAQIMAQYFDVSYQLNTTALLEVAIKPADGGRYEERPMTLLGQTYVAALDDLPAGDYRYRVRVKGLDAEKTGSFRILSIDREGNSGFGQWSKMDLLAQHNQGKLYGFDQAEALLHFLKTPEQFTQKEIIETKTTSLIQWYYALFLVILSSAIEWWLRKYNGYT
jgi:hypothetical protein